MFTDLIENLGRLNYLIMCHATNNRGLRLGLPSSSHLHYFSVTFLIHYFQVG